jgi:bifunctional UDP-N-acetylglucosamine pyrophosphorylase/glucosamine-1-phosphate N-acetyltransferase
VEQKLMSEDVAALVLAAGQGKRLKSARSKVLLELDGVTLIRRVIDAARMAGASRVAAVVGFDKENVIRALPPGVDWIEQTERLGTGHAVRIARPLFDGYDGALVVLAGDVPGIRPESLGSLAARVKDEKTACAVLTFEADGPHAYGRIARDAAGRVKKIVEHKDATEAERRITEVNSGTYAFRAGPLFECLDEVRNNNASGEYYLTDAVALLLARGWNVDAVKLENADEALGVNTPEDFERVKDAWGRRVKRPM